MSSCTLSPSFMPHLLYHLDIPCFFSHLAAPAPRLIVLVPQLPHHLFTLKHPFPPISSHPSLVILTPQLHTIHALSHTLPRHYCTYSISPCHLHLLSKPHRTHTMLVPYSCTLMQCHTQQQPPQPLLYLGSASPTTCTPLFSISHPVAATYLSAALLANDLEFATSCHLFH